MAIPRRVSVGLPVHNGIATVERAIVSVLGQTWSDLELVISDNCSTDGTEALCRRYAAQDARIRYTRHPTLIGPLENFAFVLREARAPYFMWLAADDYILPAMIERSVEVLDGNPGVVCAVPKARLVDPDGTTRPALGTFALTGSLRDNVCAFLHDPNDNSRFYGVYRRPALLHVLPRSAYFAADWTISVGTLLFGTHHELSEVLLVREANDRGKYVRMIETAFASAPSRLLPLLPFTRSLLALRIPLSACSIIEIIRHNAGQHVEYARYRYPRYGRAAHVVGAAVERARERLAVALRTLRRGGAP
jgi:glycosyltransferase involved in cell wall biosynthesis